jgi:general stress protein 26
METTFEKFKEVLGKFDTAMLTTINGEGQMHSRPMAIAELEENGDLIFFTNQESAKIQEIEGNPAASATCQNSWKDSVVIRGTASLFRDAAKAKKLWRKTYQTWFPGGRDDPSLVMIRLRGEFAEYWDNSGAQGIKYLFKAAKAIATRSRPEPDSVDEHGTVKLR